MDWKPPLSSSKTEGGKMKLAEVSGIGSGMPVLFVLRSSYHSTVFSDQNYDYILFKNSAFTEELDSW